MICVYFILLTRGLCSQILLLEVHTVCSAAASKANTCHSVQARKLFKPGLFLLLHGHRVSLFIEVKGSSY